MTLQHGPTINLQLTDTTQLGQNAASQVVTLITNSSQNLSVFADGVHGSLVMQAGSITTTGLPVSIDGSVDLTITTASDVRWTEARVMVLRGGTGTEQSGTVVGSTFDLLQAFRAPANSPVSLRLPVTLNINDSPAAGSHTYWFIIATNTTSAGGSPLLGGLTSLNPSLKIREYKR